MKGLIDRQAAMDAICEDGTQLERQGQYSITMVERKQRDADILEALPSAQPGWIPCEKELPGIREEVIATDGAFVYVASRCWYPDTNVTVWENSDGWTIDAKAWMPLPEPYVENNGQV